MTRRLTHLWASKHPRTQADLGGLPLPFGEFLHDQMYGDLVVVPIPAELQEGDGDGAAGAGVRSAP